MLESRRSGLIGAFLPKWIRLCHRAELLIGSFQPGRTFTASSAAISLAVELIVRVVVYGVATPNPRTEQHRYLPSAKGRGR